MDRFRGSNIFFKDRLKTRNPLIKWDSTESNVSSEFLDVHSIITFNSDTQLWSFNHNIYCKPLSTYQYLPYPSFQGKSIAQAWIKAEIFSCETLCIFEPAFDKAKGFLCAQLVERGYPISFLKRIATQLSFSEVKRLEALRKQQNTQNTQASQQLGCILSISRYPCSKELIEKLRISPRDIKAPFLKKIFPEAPMTVYKNAPNMRAHLPDRRREQKEQASSSS